MTGKHVARGLLLAAGMLFAGCGGEEVSAESSPSLETREDRIICNSSTYFRSYFYSDATYTQMVGERTCDCLGYLGWGRITAFVQEESLTCG